MTVWPKTRLSATAIWMSSLLALPVALAQNNDKTDTGGGMGGTGNHPEKGLMAETRNFVSPGCANGQIVGFLTRIRANKTPEPDEPLCNNQSIKTLADESVKISLRLNGESQMNANSEVVVRMTNAKSVLFDVRRGMFQANHPDQQVTYRINLSQPNRSLSIAGGRFSLWVIPAEKKHDATQEDIDITAMAIDSLSIDSEERAMKLASGQKAIVRVRGDIVIFNHD